MGQLYFDHLIHFHVINASDVVKGVAWICWSEVSTLTDRDDWGFQLS